MVVAVELVFGADPPLPDPDDRLVLGTTTVTVTLGVVFVTLVPDFVGVLPDPLVGVWPDPLVGFLFLPAPGVYDANSTVPLEFGV